MAVYTKLLLSAGGGVVSTQQQAQQAENTASILIGLGGTGIDCLRTIKTQVYSRLKPDDPEAAAPTYAHIRFLGVDSAEKTKGTVKSEEEISKADALLPLDDTEFFSIADPNVKKNFANYLALEQRTELAWLDWKNIDAPDLGKAGAGGIRQVGRYMMMEKSALFLSRIEQEINSAKSGLSQPTVNIHIFSGLSGGTGAGCFLDVCYMVRSIADKVGGVTIFGYFFLPDVNLSKIPFSDTKTRAYIPKNGYASMQELDYCMQLQHNGGGFVQEYQGHNKIDWKSGPVDMCHLICSTNSAGDVIPNAYDYAMNVTTEYVMDFLTYSDEAFGLSEQLSNFRQKINTGNGEKVIGSNLAYCVIGASCASIPLREINTYLASELFSEFSTIANNIPTKSDVEKLAVNSLAKNARSMEEIYNSLYREVRDGAGDDYSPYADDWKFVRDYGNSDMVTHYTNQTAAKKNRLETNAKSMSDSENKESLIGRVEEQLSYILKDITTGPIFAYRMISAAESHNLLNIIDGLIQENTSRWNQEAAQNDLRTRDYEGAKSDFENRTRRKFADNDEKRFNDYEYYLMILQQHFLAVSVYEKLNRLLRDFRKQISDASAGYYIKLSRVMETLINTFKENRDALASEKIMQSSSSFSIPMMTIAELKKPLDEEIEKINVRGMMDTFMQLLIDNETEWILEDENKVTKLVTKFFVETAFEGFANRTITSFLKDKYDLDNDEQLANRVYEDWMKLLTAKASPLFYFNGSIWRESQTSKLAFLSIPTSSSPIKAAAKKMYDTDPLWRTKESALTDRIYVMCSACALPLSSYNNCEEYEAAFFSTTDAGRHYYVGKPIPGMLFDDWGDLSSLTPQSMIMLEKAPDRMRVIVQKGQKIYDRAEKCGMFDDKNRICLPDKDKIVQIEALIQTANDFASKMTRQDEVQEATRLINELSTAYSIPMKTSEYAMQNDGFAERIETKNRVRKDHFVSAPAYQIIVEKALNDVSALQDAISQAKEKLQAKVDHIQVGNRNVVDYCDALFTGVISIQGLAVVYKQIQYGTVCQEHVLSKRGEGYEFGMIPVYQGFLNYQKLDSNIRADIRKVVDERYNSDSPELHETGTQLKIELSDEKISSWVQRASSFEQRAEIIEFLGKMKQQFNIFCMDYSL